MLRRASSVAWWILAISFPIAMGAGVLGWFDDPRLGVAVSPLPDGRMAITKILPGGPVYELSPAEVGDILIELDGLAVTEELINRRGTTGTSFAIAKLDTNGVRTGIFQAQDEPPISSTAVAVSLLIIGSVFALTSFLCFPGRPGLLKFSHYPCFSSRWQSRLPSPRLLPAGFTGPLCWKRWPPVGPRPYLSHSTFYSHSRKIPTG